MNSSKPPSKETLEYCHRQWPEEPLPTAEEIEQGSYCTDQVARMHQRIAELEAFLQDANGLGLFEASTGSGVSHRDLCKRYAALLPKDEE